MNRNASNRGSKRGKRDATKALGQISSTLNTIRDLELSQITSTRPEVRDVPRMIKSNPKPVMISRTYAGPGIGGSTTIDQFGSYQFTLDSVANYQEFTNLFDKFRILQAVVKFVPVSRSTVSGPCFTVIDSDDAAVPTALSDLFQYESLQITESGCMFERTLVPFAAVAAYNGSTFTGYTVKPPGEWSDCATPNIRFYGLKYAVSALSTTTAGVLWSTFVTLVLQFKDVR